MPQLPNAVSLEEIIQDNRHLSEKERDELSKKITDELQQSENGTVFLVRMGTLEMELASAIEDNTIVVNLLTDIIKAAKEADAKEADKGEIR